MLQVDPDDIVISYANGRSAYVGRAADRATFSIIPIEYGEARWNRAGRILPVQWAKAVDPFYPKEHLSIIVSMLPTRYSPLQTNGNANITYLSAISDALGRYVIAQMGWPENTLPSAVGAVDAHELAQKVEGDWADRILEDVVETERSSVGKARTKQGLYRANLQRVEAGCRVTGISDVSLLIASHAKPWSVCDNHERVNANNGLLLALMWTTCSSAVS